MEWSKQNTRELIEEFHTRRCLWDPICPDFKNRVAKRDNFIELGVMFNTGYKDIENKIHSMKSQFLREHNKVVASKKSGSGSHEIYVPKWYGYDLLLFLKDVSKPRASISTIQVSTEENDDSISNLRYCEEVHENEEITEIEEPEVQEPSQKRNKRNKTVSPAYDAMHILKSASDHILTKTEDQHTVFAKYVESELREIKSSRRLLLLKKKIQDAIFEARLEEMDEGSPSEDKNIPPRDQLSKVNKYKKKVKNKVQSRYCRPRKQPSNITNHNTDSNSAETSLSLKSELEIADTVKQEPEEYMASEYDESLTDPFAVKNEPEELLDNSNVLKEEEENRSVEPEDLTSGTEQVFVKEEPTVF